MYAHLYHIKYSYSIVIYCALYQMSKYDQYLDGSRCKTVAETQLAGTKMPRAPLAFP